MNHKLRIFLLFLVSVSNLLFATLAKADPPPDILDVYIITIAPQANGMLIMNYTLQGYCTYSDWPSDQPYLQIGVPNSNFEITNWGPKEGPFKVVEAEKITSGGTFVQLDFDKSNLPKNGDCFSLSFSIEQGKMAYTDPENGNITFKFIPAGWDFPIQVKTLTVGWIWEIPGDQSLLKLAEPKPSGSDGTSTIWQWVNPSVDASKMFHDSTIKLAYDKSAFSLSEEATTKTDQANGGEPLDLTFCLTIILIVVVILVVIFIIAVIFEAFDGGDGIGPASGRVIGGTFDAIDDVLSSSGGGYGGSSGHGSGCACAGCACACACAGGGKVGCSRKGIGISCLLKVITEMTKDTEN